MSGRGEAPIAYVRELQRVASTIPAAGPAARAALPAPSPDQPPVIDGEIVLPHSILPPSASGPAGTAAAAIARQKRGGEGRFEPNVRRFFSLVLFADGLQALYVSFGLLLGGWLLVAVPRRAAPAAALALAGIYWLVIGAIGLLLLPAFYL